MVDWESVMNAVKESNVNRVLILSLGTGNIKIKEKLSAEQAYELNNDETVYRSANYQMSGENEITTSCFVAAPLIKRVRPNTIIILGTVKSAWSEIYKSFYNGSKDKCDYELFASLFEKEREYGIQTPIEIINTFQEHINTIYRKDKVFHSLCPDVEVKVILTQYGINENELRKTYSRVSSMYDCMKKDMYNLVSFDITHSFRSMPLYNLIVLNYLNSLTSLDVEIEHIYYGNLEISSEYICENRSVAVVSDLSELSNVLNLTNAVSEFKNTGNAKSVIGLLPVDTEIRKRIKECLQQFDWATQLNDLNKMEGSLRDLMKSISKELFTCEKNSEKFLDIYTMINDVLNENFPSIDEFETMNELHNNPAIYGQIQTKLGKWFLKTNRYGQAVLVATEAVRSYMVPIYLIKENKEVTRSACEKETNRDGAEKLLGSFFESNIVKGSLGIISTQINVLKRIRNVYAHNLSDRREYQTENNEIQKKIENYYDKLEDLGKEIEKKWELIREHYCDSFVNMTHELCILGLTNSKISFTGFLENGDKAIINRKKVQNALGIREASECFGKKYTVRINTRLNDYYEVSLVSEKVKK